MKLIIQIPCLNEAKSLPKTFEDLPTNIEGVDSIEVLVIDDGSTDNTSEVAKELGVKHIVRFTKRKGLARAFGAGLDAALKAGADIIVNTDADNHYNQSRIGDLVRPILENRAEIVIGSRKVEELESMPFWNKHLNRLGSFITTRMGNLPPVDVSTGFRAYSREAALRIQVFSNHTYTHTTLISASDQRLSIVEVPIKARKVTRKSRLIPSIPHFIMNAGAIILRNLILFKPLRFFGLLGGVISVIGVIGVVRFLIYYWFGGGEGHIQSLVLSGVLIIVGFQVGIMGLVASAIGWSRRLTEEALYHLRVMDYDRDKNPR